MDNTLSQWIAQATRQIGNASDPSALMLQLLQDRLSARKQHEGKSPANDSLDTLAKTLKRARKLNRILRDELQGAMFLIADTGRLLGACPNCLGRAPDCADCGGEGGPGQYSHPAEELEEWLRPSALLGVKGTNRPQYPPTNDTRTSRKRRQKHLKHEGESG